MIFPRGVCSLGSPKCIGKGALELGEIRGGAEKGTQKHGMTALIHGTMGALQPENGVP